MQSFLAVGSRLVKRADISQPYVCNSEICDKRTSSLGIFFICHGFGRHVAKQFVWCQLVSVAENGGGILSAKTSNAHFD